MKMFALLLLLLAAGCAVHLGDPKPDPRQPPNPFDAGEITGEPSG